MSNELLDKLRALKEVAGKWTTQEQMWPLLDECISLADQQKEGKEGERWVSVERPPELLPAEGDARFKESGEVVFSYPSDTCEDGHRIEQGSFQLLPDGRMRYLPQGGKPTHWMPKPSPPSPMTSTRTDPPKP